MHYTEHYQLNQWEANDKVQRVDFNRDNEKIDSAIKAEADARAAAMAQLSKIIASKADISSVEKCGNCQLVTGSFTGTGGHGIARSRTLTFAHHLLAVFIPDGLVTAFFRPLSSSIVFGSYNWDPCTVTWTKNSMTWYSNYDQSSGLNVLDKKYTYLAVLLKE